MCLTMMTSKTIKGFKVIPIQFSATSSSQHHLFIKEHTARNHSSDKPTDRTLFILNIPPYATEDSVKAVFSPAGPVKSVTFHSKPQSAESSTNETTEVTGFKVAYLVFENSSSVKKALNFTSLQPFSTEKHPVATGFERMTTQYNNSICDNKKLQESVDRFMAIYDKEQKKIKQEKEVNDSGWTVVTKKGRNPGLSRKKSLEDKLSEKNNKADKRKYLDDFYVFQKKEAKMKRVTEMRKEFEQAKKKVEALKQARKFKPY